MNNAIITGPEGEKYKRIDRRTAARLYNTGYTVIISMCDVINPFSANTTHLNANWANTPDYITKLPTAARFGAICDIFKTFNKSPKNGYTVAFYAKID